MVKNFIIITLRSLARQRVYTFLNVLGLAVGMACALLISIYLIHELSYDKLHPDADRIYRVSVDGILRGQPLRIAVTSSPMASAIIKEYDEVESAVRIIPMGAWLVSNSDTSFNEDKLFFADTNFFEFFSFPVIAGNPDSILTGPYNLVLTRSTALRYFGEYNVTGRKLKVETFDELFTVSAVIEDIPSNSHFHFDILGSAKLIDRFIKPIWVSNNVYTYIKVRPGVDIERFENDLNLLVSKYVAPEIKKYFGSSDESFADGTNIIRYNLQEITKIHLTSDLDIEFETNGNARYLYSLGILALLILIVACINFIHLSTANSANRAREVVLRKVAGSERNLLILQFLTESVIFSVAALIFALLITELVMPQFNRFLGLELKFAYLNNFMSIGIIIFFALIMGLAAGSYPAFFISSYDPVRVMQGNLNMGVRNSKVRSVFVAIQFFISILVIILTLFVFAQVKHMTKRDMGFDKDRILVVRRPDALKDKIEKFKIELLQHPNIESVANSNSIPGRNFLASSFMIINDTVRQNAFMSQLFVSYDFIETYGLNLLKGRSFSDSVKSDSNAVIINETAARALMKDTVLGTYLGAPTLLNRRGENLKIIGVVKDFNFETVDKPIDPLVISLMKGNWEGYLNIRLKNKGVEGSLGFIEKTWKSYTTEYPFLYFFLDEDLDKNYSPFIRTGKILLIFALFSVFVACLGLFGLILFTSNQRTREIGIRKSIGATYLQILLLIMKETFYLNLIASLFAWITAYLLIKIWLKDFYSHITITPGYFVLSSVIVLVVSLTIVVYQSFLASKSDPSVALKTN
jgi:putative ABC transport system permease protein